MRKESSLELYAWLTSVLTWQMQPARPLEKWVAIMLWKLATPGSYQSVRNQFGMGK